MFRFPKRLLITALLGSLLAIAISANAGKTKSKPSAKALTAKQIAEKVQKFYDKTKTYQAKFKQVYRIKVQNVKKVSTGKVAFQKPGMLSFRYDKPNGNRVVSDGKIIKVYERENQQMYKTKVKMSQYPAALAFLMGKGKLIRDFKLRKLDSKRMKFEGGYVILGTPKEATPAYKKLLLYVDAQTSQVRRVLILDAQGNRNRFDFKSPVVNKKIDKKEFQFTPPKGTTIVKP